MGGMEGLASEAALTLASKATETIDLLLNVGIVSMINRWMRTKGSATSSNKECKFANIDIYSSSSLNTLPFQAGVVAWMVH